MSSNQPITKEFFIKRLVNLCLRSGLSGLPKDHVNQHILLKSAVLTLGKSEILTEQQLNKKLQYWIEHIIRIKNIDHVTLRRMLVDTGYLTRNNDGSCYHVSPSSPGSHLFIDSIDRIDITEVIRSGREEIAQRKREYMAKSGAQAKKV